MNQNAPKVKTALLFGIGFAISLGSGCTTTRTLSVSPANPTAATSDQGVTCLRSVKRNAVTVWLLTPKYQTDLRKFDPPAFRVLVRNGGDKAFDFSPVNVTASSGGNSVHVFTGGEYCREIDRQAQATLTTINVGAADAKEKADALEANAAEALPQTVQDQGKTLYNFASMQKSSSSDAKEKIETQAANRRAEIMAWRKELLDEARLMLVQHTVAPGLMAGGIIKLDPDQISRGQPLKLVVTVGGEAHEFVFEVGS